MISELPRNYDKFTHDIKCNGVTGEATIDLSDDGYLDNVECTLTGDFVNAMYRELSDGLGFGSPRDSPLGYSDETELRLEVKPKNEVSELNLGTYTSENINYPQYTSVDSENNLTETYSGLVDATINGTFTTQGLKMNQEGLLEEKFTFDTDVSYILVTIVRKEDDDNLYARHASILCREPVITDRETLIQ